MRQTLTTLLLTSIGIIYGVGAKAQPSEKSSSNKYKVVVAGPQYEKSARFQKKWGEHYRKEWATPVKVRIVHLDTLEGGLIPYQKGGGRQSKTLRLRDHKGQEYVLRSIDKTFGKALPEIYQGTFIETIINDQVSIAHPYSAVTISPMAKAAKIFHTNPQIIYIPAQPALGAFNNEFANQLFLFEQRPDENWGTADNFGNSTRIIGTEKMLEELLEDHNNSIDQQLYVRSRLFDLFIGDWGRHEDQWRWGTFNNDNGKLFKPIPRDRDQAYTLFDGKKLGSLMSKVGIDHLQSFDTTIRDVTTYNFPARNLDRRAANEMTLESWIGIAKELQSLLTDQVIESAIRQMPEEVFPISGNAIITKLKSRRDHLVGFATDYYKFISQGVDIIGSDKKEVFIVNRLDDDRTLVEVYKLNASESQGKKLLYSRTFNSDETNEVRLYGLGGEDIVNLQGRVNNGILVRVVGGAGNDLINDSSWVKGAKKMTLIYDTERPLVYTGSESKLRVTNDTLVTNYKYNFFDYDDKGFFIKPSASSISIGYGIKKEQWGNDPMGTDHSIRLKYRFLRQALNLEYNGIIYQALGKWNLTFTAGAGFPNVVNYFGIGNESAYDHKLPSHFNRLRSQEFYAKTGINRFAGNHRFAIGAFYHNVNILDDEDRVIARHIPLPGSIGFFSSITPINLDRRHFVGTEGSYRFIKRNHPVVPTSGFNFSTLGSYTYNITETDRSYTRVEGDVSAYVPVFKFISLAFRVGAANNFGKSEFYQLNQLGSHDNLRGFRKYRFYGKQMAYTNNEVRFMFNHKSKLFNGKIGLIGFYDMGRVWQPGESSNKWHAGYGGGIFIAPFNKIVLAANYGKSDEAGVFTFHTGFFF